MQVGSAVSVVMKRDTAESVATEWSTSLVAIAKPCYLANGSIVLDILLNTAVSLIKSDTCKTQDTADSFTTEAFTLLGVGIAVIVLRTVARTIAVGVKGFQFDDYLMCVAAVRITELLVLVFAKAGAGHILVRNGRSLHRRRLVAWACEQRHDRRAAKEIKSRVARILATSRRIQDAVSRLEPLHALIMDLETLHVPLLLETDSRSALSRAACQDYCQPAISKIDLYVTVILNVLTDVYLMSIPLPMLWKAHLEIKRKLSLLLIFGGGIFVIMAGILRCVLIIKDPVNGAQAAGSWVCHETFVAVVIGNMPMIYPLTRRGVKKVYSMAGGSRNNGHQRDGDSLPLKSGPSRLAHCGKPRSFHGPPTWTDDLALDGWASERSGSIRHTKSHSRDTIGVEIRDSMGGIQVTRETILRSEARKSG
ncbi:hypothetical protein OPT61_g8169 [Boeremia exigua]|uniref:Uncharacterized protein n=1 Tax=Boeremia exigua TaxID=749465 RepID=A0ACC2HZR8_9PLEO|nr:hypothetical protein OPT61_g8169 [Boeremia exigua]